jgi:type I restriction enzyme R subunit
VKALLTELPQETHGRLDLGDRVFLTHLRLEKTGDHDLSLTHGAGEVPGFRGDGSGRQDPEEEKDRLSELIRELNDRFGTNLGKADQLSLQGIVEDMSEDGDLVAKAEENNEQNFRFAFDKKFEPAVLDR